MPRIFLRFADSTGPRCAATPGSASDWIYNHGELEFETGASRSRTVAGTCPQVSDRLPCRPREYEIDQAGVLW